MYDCRQCVPSPAEVAPIPNDDPSDHDIILDEDKNLPWPEIEKLTALELIRLGDKPLPNTRARMSI